MDNFTSNWLLLLAFIPAFFFGCAGNPPSSSHDLSTTPQEDMTTINSISQPADLPALEKWKTMLGNSLSQMIKELSAEKKHYDSNRAYEKLEKLTWLHKADKNPAHFYFKEERLYLIYLNESAEVVEQLSPADLFAELGPTEPDAILRSRAGKLSQHYTYPEQGIAFSVENDKLVFIELFVNMSLKTYLDQIYLDHGPFKL